MPISRDGTQLLPRLTLQDKRAEWVDNDCLGTVEFPVTADQVVEHARPHLDYMVTKDMVRSVMDLLVRGHLAKRSGQDEYGIRYKRFNPRADEQLSDEVNLEQRLDHTKQGLIRAIAGVRPTARARPPGRRDPVRRGRRRADKAQMTMGLE